MNLENHVFNAKNALDHGLHKLNVEEYDASISFFAAAYSEVRALLECAWRIKRKAAIEAQPPGENAR